VPRGAVCAARARFFARPKRRAPRTVATGLTPRRSRSRRAGSHVGRLVELLPKATPASITSWRETLDYLSDGKGSSRTGSRHEVRRAPGTAPCTRHASRAGRLSSAPSAPSAVSTRRIKARGRGMRSKTRRRHQAKPSLTVGLLQIATSGRWAVQCPTARDGKRCSSPQPVRGRQVVAVARPSGRSGDPRTTTRLPLAARRAFPPGVATPAGHPRKLCSPRVSGARAVEDHIAVDARMPRGRTPADASPPMPWVLPRPGHPRHDPPRSEQACAALRHHPLSLRLLAGLIMTDLQQRRHRRRRKRLDVSGDLIQRRHHVLRRLITPSRRRGGVLSQIACSAAGEIRGPHYVGEEGIHSKGVCTKRCEEKKTSTAPHAW